MSLDKEEIIIMAREAGFKLGTSWYGGISMLERFASIVASYEREECAKMLDEYWWDMYGTECAEIIRSRGEINE